jgi:hypothetical protein
LPVWQGLNPRVPQACAPNKTQRFRTHPSKTAKGGAPTSGLFIEWNYSPHSFESCRQSVLKNSAQRFFALRNLCNWRNAIASYRSLSFPASSALVLSPTMRNTNPQWLSLSALTSRSLYFIICMITLPVAWDSCKSFVHPGTALRAFSTFNNVSASCALIARAVDSNRISFILIFPSN